MSKGKDADGRVAVSWPAAIRLVATAFTVVIAAGLPSGPLAPVIAQDLDVSVNAVSAFGQAGRVSGTLAAIGFLFWGRVELRKPAQLGWLAVPCVAMALMGLAPHGQAGLAWITGCAALAGLPTGFVVATLKAVVLDRKSFDRRRTTGRFQVVELATFAVLISAIGADGQWGNWRLAPVMCAVALVLGIGSLVRMPGFPAGGGAVSEAGLRGLFSSRPVVAGLVVVAITIGAFNAVYVALPLIGSALGFGPLMIAALGLVRFPALLTLHGLLVLVRRLERRAAVVLPFVLGAGGVVTLTLAWSLAGTAARVAALVAGVLLMETGLSAILPQIDAALTRDGAGNARVLSLTMLARTTGSAVTGPLPGFAGPGAALTIVIVSLLGGAGLWAVAARRSAAART